MNEATFNFWQKWLTWANVITLIIGILFAFVGNSFIFKLHNSYTEKVFFGGDIISGDMLQFKNWLFGIIGGSSISIYTGALYNVIIINLVALVLIGLPLLMTRKVFYN